jgi:serine/threonine-protein kinase
MLTDSATLVQVLRESYLLPGGQLKQVEQELKSQFASPAELLDELKRRGWLTPFQADLIAAGKWQELLLGPYVLLDLLGEGGMGQVYKAFHRILKAVRAVKVIRPERLASPEAVDRFYREVEAVAKLHHPNIIHAYDAGQVGGVHYFVMEYVEGVDLGKLVQQRGALPTGEACEYVRQAAEGLQHAHERGLVHRDIKPSNLFLVPAEKRVKVLDLGLARVSRPDDGTSQSALTQDGVMMGTADFMSPEQARDSHYVDIRADVYSLGCSLYQLVTGRVPFPGGTFMEKMIRHWTHEPEPVGRVRPQVPGPVAAVVARMMAKRPEDRFQTPGEAAAALAPFCQAATAFSQDTQRLPPSASATADTEVKTEGGPDTADLQGTHYTQALSPGTLMPGTLTPGAPPAPPAWGPARPAPRPRTTGSATERLPAPAPAAARPKSRRGLLAAAGLVVAAACAAGVAVKVLSGSPPASSGMAKAPDPPVRVDPAVTPPPAAGAGEGKGRPAEEAKAPPVKPAPEAVKPEVPPEGAGPTRVAANTGVDNKGKADIEATKVGEPRRDHPEKPPSAVTPPAEDRRRGWARTGPEPGGEPAAEARPLGAGGTSASASPRARLLHAVSGALGASFSRGGRTALLRTDTGLLVCNLAETRADHQAVPVHPELPLTLQNTPPRLTAAALSADGTRAVYGTKTRRPSVLGTEMWHILGLVDLRNPDEQRFAELWPAVSDSASVTAAACSEGGTRVLFGTSVGSVFGCDFAGGPASAPRREARLYRPEFSEPRVSQMAVSDDGRLALWGGAAGSLVLRDLTNRGEGAARRWEGHGRALVSAVALSPAGGKAASGDEDGRVLVWDVLNPDATPEAVGQLQQGRVSALAFSADGRLLLSGSAAPSGADGPGSVRLWDLADLRRPVWGAACPSDVLAVAFADGGAHALAADKAGVRQWFLPEVLAASRPAGGGAADAAAAKP